MHTFHQIKCYKRYLSLCTTFIRCLNKEVICVQRLIGGHGHSWLFFLHYFLFISRECPEWLVSFRPLVSGCSLGRRVNIPISTWEKNRVKLERWVKVKHAPAALVCRRDASLNKLVGKRWCALGLARETPERWKQKRRSGEAKDNVNFFFSFFFLEHFK